MGAGVCCAAGIGLTEGTEGSGWLICGRPTEPDWEPIKLVVSEAGKKIDRPVGSIRGIRKLEHPQLTANKLTTRVATSHLPRRTPMGERARRVELWHELIIANQSFCFHTCPKEAHIIRIALRAYFKA